jgi:hypothetical protein
MRNVTSVVLGFIVLVLSSSRLAGQVTISAMAQDLEPVEKSSDVKVIRLGSFEEEDAVAKEGEKTVLNAGDEVRCVSGKTTVELTSVSGASTTLSEPFRVVVLPPTRSDRPCWINILQGAAEVVSEEPTMAMIGETTLGTRRTRYGMRVGRYDRQLRTEISVYEGQVSVRGLNARSSVETGNKMIIRKAEHEVVPLEAADFKRAAAAYATIDTVKSKVAREPSQARKKVYEELEARYIRVLQEPEDWVSYRNLAVAQLNLGIPGRAMYNLNRATSPKTQEAAVVLCKSIAHIQSGDLVAARMLYQEAREMDPSVNKLANLKKYKIDPRLITMLQEVRLPSIVISAQTRPSRVAPGERIQIVVRAFTKDRKPLRDADVAVRAGGGSFAGTGKTRVSGRTDAHGNFAATWSCRPCASAYVFNVEVLKLGFEKATAQTEVNVR